MNLIWSKSESKESPIAIDEQTSQTGVYLRENIVFTDDKYIYDETYISKDEYVEYKLTKAIASTIELKQESDIIDAYTLKLIQEGSL